MLFVKFRLLEKRCLVDVVIRVICILTYRLFTNGQAVLKAAMAQLLRSLFLLCLMTVNRSVLLMGLTDLARYHTSYSGLDRIHYRGSDLH